MLHVACCMQRSSQPRNETRRVETSGEAMPCCQLFLRFIKIVINWHLNAQTQKLRDDDEER